jgi:hypothetical protein
MREQPFLDQILEAAGRKRRAAVLMSKAVKNQNWLSSIANIDRRLWERVPHADTRVPRVIATLQRARLMTIWPV